MNRYRDYSLVFSSYALSLLGTGIAIVGLTLIAFDLEQDDAGQVLASAFVIKTIAYIGVAPVASAFAGRVPKRELLFVLNLLRAAAVLLLPFARETWQIYALIFLFSAASAVYIPTYQTIVPYLLPDVEAYNRALTKARVANEFESALSPLFAAGLLLAFTHNGLFVVAAAIFVLSAACLTSSHIPALRAVSGAEVWTNVRRGLSLFVERRPLRYLIPVAFVVSLATAMVMVNTVVLVQGLFGLGERETALGLAAFGLGALAGAVLMLPLLNRFGARATIIGGSLLTVAGLLGGPLITSFANMLALWAALGLGSGLALTPTSLVLRDHPQKEDRALIYATYFSLTNICLLVAYPLAGWIGANLGLRAGFLLPAALAGIAALLAIYLSHAGAGTCPKTFKRLQ